MYEFKHNGTIATELGRCNSLLSLQDIFELFASQPRQLNEKTRRYKRRKSSSHKKKFHAQAALTKNEKNRHTREEEKKNYDSVIISIFFSTLSLKWKVLRK